ncbi:MAG TPA: aldose epimerase family protein [Kiritimatiellia bacterium]|nr:aldose epimerase family protein [Kiritimatiellia bacterium]
MLKKERWYGACFGAFLLLSLQLRAGPIQRVGERPFGRTPAGEEVTLYTLRNAHGMVASVMGYGATITELRVPDRDGKFTNVVLGADSLEAYTKGFSGAASVIGRFANRIANARFTLDGQEFRVTANAGQHQIHGGRNGFARKVWQGEILMSIPSAAAVCFRLRSPDGDEGFPGTLDVTVTYTLNDNNELRIDYMATTDKPTPVNFTNHAYFNLAGDGDVWDHQVWIDADRITTVDAELIPTGEYTPVAGTPLDFTEPTAIGARIESLIPSTKGYDHNYVVRNGGQRFALAAWCYEPRSGRLMHVYTDQPGMQLYTGKRYFRDGKPVAATPEQKHNTVCFETQHFPNAVNHPHFPSTILRPGKPFRSATAFRFSTATSCPTVR